MNQNGKKRCHSLQYGQKKQVSKMFIISRGNLTELQTTPLSQAITVHVVPKLLLLQLTLVTLKIKGT